MDDDEQQHEIVSDEQLENAQLAVVPHQWMPVVIPVPALRLDGFQMAYQAGMTQGMSQNIQVLRGMLLADHQREEACRAERQQQQQYAHAERRQLQQYAHAERQNAHAERQDAHAERMAFINLWGNATRANNSNAEAVAAVRTAVEALGDRLGKYEEALGDRLGKYEQRNERRQQARHEDLKQEIFMLCFLLWVVFLLLVPVYTFIIFS